MPTQFKGRRAVNEWGLASSKQWGLKNLFDHAFVIGHRSRVPGGTLAATKLHPFTKALVDIPDPDMVFIRLDDEGATLPRFVGRAGELPENAIGRQHPSQAAGVPFNMYAAPHHLGGGFYSNPVYDADPQIGEDPRTSEPIVFEVAGVEIFSKHPMVRYVPYASQVGTILNTFVLPQIGICPLGERTPGVWEFIFHICPPGANPIAIKTDTDHMDAGEGTAVALPAALGDSFILYTPHFCPIGRGEAAYLQVYSDADDIPRAIYLSDWGATLNAQSLDSIDPGYTADTETPFQPLPPHTASFARISDDALMFMYYNADAEETRLFVADNGFSWAQVPAPLASEAWKRHIPVGIRVAGPSLLTCFGQGCVMFATVDEDTTDFNVWRSVDSGETWEPMEYEGIVGTVAAAGPTVILPYQNEDNQGEMAILVFEEDPEEGEDTLTTYVSHDVGRTWSARGPANPTPSINDPWGFNQHMAYVGTYDRPAPVLAGLPDLMRFQE